MMTQTDHYMKTSLKRYSLLASAISMAIGLLVLAGWWFDVAALKSVFPGQVMMKVEAALAFLLAGVSLYLFLPGQPSFQRRITAQICAFLVLLVGLLAFLQYLLGWEFGVDLPLFEEIEDTIYASLPSRMVTASAINFFFLGLALLTLDAKRAIWLGQGLVLVTLLISLITLAGYIYDAKALYGIGPDTSMALYTTIGFMVLSTGVLCARPDRGYITVLTGSDAAGIMARRLLPAVIILPLVTGWINLMGAQKGMYSPEFRISILTVSSIVIFSILIWLNARSLFRMDAERRHAERKFEELLQAAPDAMVIVNKDGNIVLVNSQAETLFGYQQEEMLGQRVEMLMPKRYRNIHKQHRKGYFTELQVRSMGQGPDLYGQRKDDSQFPIAVSLSPLVTEKGTLVTAAIRDITERKQVEEALARQAEELTRQAAELTRSNSELSQFAYVASHDLQEPLRAIAGCVQLLQHRFQSELDSRTQELIFHTVDGVTRMQSLIDDLLTLSRLGARGEPFQYINSSAALGRAVANLQISIAESGALVTQDPLPEVMADPMQLMQLFQNLIGNAIKFRRDEIPRIHISAEIQNAESDLLNSGAIDPSLIVRHSSFPEEWVFSVKDNGIGIEREYHERIFGVFQRLHTRKEHPGTGIGLAICRKIVERHGGHIWVESEPGKGATFYFTLPNLNGIQGSGVKDRGRVADL